MAFPAIARISRLRLSVDGHKAIYTARQIGCNLTALTAVGTPVLGQMFLPLKRPVGGRERRRDSRVGVGCLALLLLLIPDDASDIQFILRLQPKLLPRRNIRHNTGASFSLGCSSRFSSVSSLRISHISSAINDLLKATSSPAVVMDPVRNSNSLHWAFSTLSRCKLMSVL